MRDARTRFWIAALTAGFVWIAALFLGGPGTQPDLFGHAPFYAADDAQLARIASIFSFLGKGVVLMGFTITAAVFLYFRRKIRVALLLITVFGGRLLVELQKLVTNRDRPDVEEHLEAVSSMAFPSAHAANAMITYLAIALLVPVKQRNRALSVALGVALALLVGWSRLALGVHWLSNVVGGWAFGLLWVAICMRLASARGDAEPSPRAR